MSAPCPFCGDEREPTAEAEDVRDSEPIYAMNCASCGAHGPMAKTKVFAAELWNGRQPAGQSAAWREFYSKKT